MDTELTYSLVYTPDFPRTAAFNPICSDKKIHIRLRDFDKPQIIKGFERKLAYLITYLINYGDLSLVSMLNLCDQKTILKAFLENEDMKQLYRTIKYEKQIDFKSFVVKANYKKSEHVAFGNVLRSVFPITYDKFGAPKEGSLKTFLEKLKLTLLEYLFDDSYSIIIHKVSTQELNAKYINKENRKVNKLLSDFEKLW